MPSSPTPSEPTPAPVSEKPASHPSEVAIRSEALNQAIASSARDFTTKMITDRAEAFRAFLAGTTTTQEPTP